MNAVQIKLIIGLIVFVISLVVVNCGLSAVKKIAIDRDFFKKGLFVLARIVLNFCVVFEALTFLVCNMLLYQPHINIEAHSNMTHKVDMEQLAYDTPVGKCTGWMYHAKNNPNNCTLIIFPGRSETSAEMMSVDGAFNNPNLGNVIVFDYPGYGMSQGLPTENNMRKMMLSAFDQITARDDVSKQNVIVWGYSLGTGIANYICSERDVDGLILMAPYRNGYDLINRFVGVYYGVFKVFLPFKMRADKYAAKVKVEPIIFSSKDDDMVSYSSSVELSKLYANGCDFHTYNNLGHGGYWSDEDVWENIFKYIAKCANNK